MLGRAREGFRGGETLSGIRDNSSLPISLSIASASPHESVLVEGAIRARYTKNVPILMNQLSIMLPERLTPAMIGEL